jgi:predicted ester cyclase
MSLEENKAIVRRWIESYNKQNLASKEAAVDEFLAPDYIDHIHHGGPEGVKQVFNMAFKGMPDWHETIEDIIAEGDKVWLRLTYTGTHTGEWFGLAPTGKKITATAVGIYRIVNGKIVEGRFVTDTLDMNKQIGAIEYTEEGKKLFPEDVE